MTKVDWGRVARHVKERRMELGLKQKGTPDVSPSVWSKIETAAAESYKPFTIAAIERTLRWPPGTIALIGGGGEPPHERPDLEERVAGLERDLRRIAETVDRLSRHLGG